MARRLLTLCPIFVVLIGGLLAPPARAEIPTATQADFREIIKRATEEVFPAVVFIKCVREGHETGESEAFEVTGSGVAISPDGEIVTNWHVIDKAVSIRCQLADGRGFHADLLGADKSTDVALLKLRTEEPLSDLPFAQLGHAEELREGDFVMAMGAPWGLNRSVSIGIIACTRRFLPEDSEYSHWLQTDASISPGNSGGPLVNTNGEVIGLNARGAFYGGDLGFAVPAETVKLVVDRVREYGSPRWSWFGFQLQPLRDFNRDMYFDGDEGVIVSETDPDSPAREAGIRPRDRILAANGSPITALMEENLPDVRRHLAMLSTEDPTTFQIERAGRVIEVDITPAPRGADIGDEFECALWDLTVKEINRFESPDLYYYKTTGVYVFGVKHPGNAALAGLLRDDIILRVGREDVTTLSEVEAAYKRAIADDSDKRISLMIMRSGSVRQLVLDFARDFDRE